MESSPGMDGGYSWVVACACFVISFIMAGLSRAAGVLYVAVIELYGVSREVATTPFSIRFSVRNMSGPLVGLLGQRYGIRAITIVGGILSGVGGALCAFAPNVFWITVLWGGVHGLGVGLCNLIHVLILNEYFEKYKATALGFVLTGDCFGTFVFPSILEILLQSYGLHGTFLILGGIALNVVPLGFMLKTPDFSKTTKQGDNLKERSSSEKLCGVTNPAFAEDYSPNSFNCSIKQNKTHSKSFRTFEEKAMYSYLKNGRSASDSHKQEKQNKEKTETVPANYNCPPFPAFKEYDVHCITYDKAGCKLKEAMQTYDKIPQYVVSETEKYITEINSDLKQALNTVSNPQIEVPIRNASVCTNGEAKDKETSALLQFLLTNTRPMFVLTAITLATYYYLFIALITIIFDYTLDIGIPGDLGKYLLIGFSMSDLFGRLGFGGVLDKKWIKASHFTGISAALMGLFVMAIPFYTNFYYVMVCMVLCGFVQGGNAIIYPILVQQYMDKKEESVALGCLNFYGGLILIPLASMIGFFRDVIGSYDGVFYIVGGLCIISGFMWVVEPCLWKYQQKISRKA